MGTDEEESLVSSGAGAAADVCKCCVWLLGPCRDSPFKRSSDEYLSAVAFWGGRDHWAHSLNKLGTRPPRVSLRIGFSFGSPSPPPPKLEAQRELTFNRSVLLVYTSRDRVCSLLRRDVSGISISIYQWRGAEVYLYRRIFNWFQKWWFLIVKKFWYVPEFKGLYGKELFLPGSSQIIIFSTFGIMKIRYNFLMFNQRGKKSLPFCKNIVLLHS